ncbi:interferon a3-like [Betta splendens]|uniref:Interferon a3-like n=1 Tax=Betta splendens TaxID=158456 RepID=A0A9W2XG47_BETSP|nr:interferon a3-like [Betta splendens]
MFSRILFLCLFVALSGTCSSLTCKWLHHNFRRYSERSMELLDSMGGPYIETTDRRDNETVPFPYPLYKQASSASAGDKLDFIVQVFEEVGALFKEDHKSVSWDKGHVEKFRMVINGQAEGFSKCIHNQRTPNKGLSDYFKALSHNILKRNGHRAEAWELIRNQIKHHLWRTDIVISSLFSAKS